MYERILVPLDGTDVAEAAVPFAELIPSRHVRLLQVEPATVTVRQDPAGMERLKLAQDERVSRAGAYLAQQAEGLRRQGRDIELVVDVGDPRERIIAAASDADLIVIGTRGKRVGGRTFGASIADHVLRNADVPTLVVRGALSQAAPMVARIVVPLDGSDVAESALPAAARLSRLLGVQLHLVLSFPCHNAQRILTRCGTKRQPTSTHRSCGSPPWTCSQHGLCSWGRSVQRCWTPFCRRTSW